MPGKIFYRERRLGEEGFEQPRYQLVALAGVDLEVFGKHLRFSELKYIAGLLDADLIRLPSLPLPAETEETLEIG